MGTCVWQGIRRLYMYMFASLCGSATGQKFRYHKESWNNRDQRHRQERQTDQSASSTWHLELLYAAKMLVKLLKLRAKQSSMRLICPAAQCSYWQITACFSSPAIATRQWSRFDGAADACQADGHGNVEKWCIAVLLMPSDTSWNVQKSSEFIEINDIRTRDSVHLRQAWVKLILVSCNAQLIL